jgi:peroxiredoxin
MSLTLNQTVPDFVLPDTDGAEVALDAASAPATVVAFTCNHCPYALAWHERINDVARDYAAQGVRFLQVNANDAVRYPGDSPEAMAKRVAGGEFASPYLHDETQEIARAWGATVTPDVYVVDREGTLRYHGAPDADHRDDSLRANWLRSALDAVLAGQEVAEAETRPVGCSIKWKA